MLSLVLLIVVSTIVKDCESKNYNSDEHPIINTSSGRVKGNILKTRFDNEFYAFRGIRYGKPPINELRFKPPEPVEYMEGIFDATEDSPACTQPYQFHIPQLTYSEDCLTLNVYTKHIPNKSTPVVKKPVILNIHGGSFVQGSASTMHLGGPHFLMEREIVLVTINYRLGLLGFLSLNTSFAPGNAGLKDQVLAMKWVKNNIEQFGGDSNSITLFGHSSGGVAAMYHLVSPMSVNLFHRAIIMSPPFLYQDKVKNHKIQSARKQAKFINCTHFSTTKQIYDCFKDADALALANSVFVLRDFYEEPANPPSMNAVIENDFGQERFLIEDPWVNLKHGNFNRVPMILGLVSDEFSGMACGLILNKKNLQEFEERFNDVGPICFYYESETELSSNISKSLWKAYELSHPLTTTDLPSIAQLYHDALVGYGIQRFLSYIQHSVDVFLYRFSYIGRFSSTYYPDDKPYGVQHTDVLAYIFPLYVIYNRTDPESIIVEQITRLWTQFALTGYPNNKNDEYIGKINWELYTSSTKYYLEMDSEMKLKNNLRMVNRLEVWDEFYSDEISN